MQTINDYNQFSVRGIESYIEQGAKILKLSLDKIWFDMILSGEKTEEYREFKKYWIDRLTEDKSYCQMGNSGYVINEKKFDYVKFTNGYGSHRPNAIFECGKIRIDKPTQLGRTKFIEEGSDYDYVFVIPIGQEVSRSNC